LGAGVGRKRLVGVLLTRAKVVVRLLLDTAKVVLLLVLALFGVGLAVDYVQAGKGALTCNVMKQVSY